VSRNNDERLSAPAAGPPPPPSLAKEQNDDLFSFVTPTDFIELPSRGEYYPKGSPLHGVKSIEIRHMTAKEEDILTSESLLRKGIVIDRLLHSLLVDKSINIDNLLVGDKNALIVGARITGYGPHYETRTTCPSCSTAQPIEFDLNNLDIRRPDLPEGVRKTDNNTYFITLPQSRLEIELRLMTGELEKSYTETTERKRKQKLPSSMVTDLLKLLIVSVNGRDDVATLNKLLEVLPIQDSTYIKSTYERISPDIDMSHEFLCAACNYEGRVAVPLTANFFWPKR
jgi:hypothetical protein